MLVQLIRAVYGCGACIWRRYEPSIRRCRGYRPSGRAVCGRRPNRRRSDTGALRKWCARRGIAASTIRDLRELRSRAPLVATRTRQVGGGRKRAADLASTLLTELDALVEPTAPGDPDSPLRWTCLSARTLAGALEARGHPISHTVVAELLLCHCAGAGKG